MTNTDPGTPTGAVTSVTVEVSDPAAAATFYTNLGPVDGIVGAALDAGAVALKPVKKSFWGYGGVVRAPDGTIVKVASSSKKDTGPATGQVDGVVLLLGVEDVKATEKFYVERGLPVARSFGSRYVEFDTQGSRVVLAL